MFCFVLPYSYFMSLFLVLFCTTFRFLSLFLISHYLLFPPCHSSIILSVFIIIAAIVFVIFQIDFGVSDAFLFGWANSRQTSIKCRHLACDIDPSLLKNCKDLTMKLEAEYLFSTSSSGANFYTYHLPEGLGMVKILAHGIKMQKISWIYAGPKSNLHPRTEISSMASVTSKLSIFIYSLILLVLSELYWDILTEIFVKKHP